MSKFLNVLGLVVAIWGAIQGFAGELSPVVAAILVIGGTTLSSLNESLLKATDLGFVSWLAPIAAALLSAVDAIGQVGLQGQTAAKWILGLKIAASALTAASAKLKAPAGETKPPDPFNPRNGSILGILLFAGVLTLSACGTKEAKALRDTAVGLNTTTKTVVTLHQQGFIGADDYKLALIRLQDVTIAHQEVIQLYRSIDAITPDSKVATLTKIDALLAALERLQSNTRIRDSTKALAFAGIVSSVRVNIGVVRAFIEAAQPGARLPK